MIARFFWEALSRLNRLLPRYAHQPDLERMGRLGQILTAWRIFVTYRTLDARNRPPSRLGQLLGPGILFASTAIGVSHLVQSTRAGALAGWGLVGAVVAANAAKYPFFEFGSRYASATGSHLIAGYRSLGKAAAWAYLILTLGTAFFVLGAIGIVTASFLDHLLGVSAWAGTNATPGVAVVLFLGSVALLAWGKFAALDRLVKVLAAVLVVSTVVAFCWAWAHTPLRAVPPPPVDFNPWSGAGLAFVVALMGWMPTAVDLSTWNSMWTLERIRATGYRPPLRDTLREFNAGYVVSAVLALLFLGIGALLLYAEDRPFPEGTAAFAAGFVDVYTDVLGGWSWWPVAGAAFSAMLGTAVACLDGYARSLSASWASVWDAPEQPHHANRALLLLASGALALILAFPSNITALVDLATTLSFLVAPAVAAANLYLVTHRMPPTARPGRALLIWSVAGLLFLVGFAVLFVAVR